MFQQQHVSGVVENYRAGSDSEVRVRRAHTPTPESRREQPPNFAAEVFEHSEREYHLTMFICDS